MVIWRAPAVEAVLGISLSEASLTEAVMKNLVPAGAREGEQLDLNSSLTSLKPPLQRLPLRRRLES